LRATRLTALPLPLLRIFFVLFVFFVPLISILWLRLLVVSEEVIVYCVDDFIAGEKRGRIMMINYPFFIHNGGQFYMVQRSSILYRNSIAIIMKEEKQE
jgi:hypothetical protein